MPRHRTVRHILGKTIARLRIGANQAVSGPGRITSLSTGDGASGILQGEGHSASGFRPSGSRNEARPTRRSSHFVNRRTSWKNAGAGAAGMGGAARHGFVTTPKRAGRAKENFDISPLPEDEFDEINSIQTRQRLNDVVNTGSPGFIPR